MRIWSTTEVKPSYLLDLNGFPDFPRERHSPIITEQNSELCEQGAARLASSQPQIFDRALSLVAGSQSSWSRDIDLNNNCVPYRLVSKHRGRAHPRLAMAL
jgi:hypothetical protein